MKCYLTWIKEFFLGYAHCVAVGFNYPGNHLFHHQNFTLSECNQECQSNSECEHSTFVVGTSECFGKHKKGQNSIVNDMNIITIPKICGKIQSNSFCCEDSRLGFWIRRNISNEQLFKAKYWQQSWKFCLSRTVDQKMPFIHCTPWYKNISLILRTFWYQEPDMINVHFGQWQIYSGLMNYSSKFSNIQRQEYSPVLNFSKEWRDIRRLSNDHSVIRPSSSGEYPKSVCLEYLQTTE